MREADPGASGGAVVVAVDESRRVGRGSGVDVWLLTDLERYVHPVRRPRQLRFEAAVLLTASRALSVDGAIGILADACQSRRTSPARLRALLDALPGNLRFRGVLAETLDDVSSGAYSYLEVRYVREVERRHGLPVGTRQRRVARGREACYRDVEYVGFNLVAELDGRLGHLGFGDHAADIDRDNDSARDGVRTVRIGYRQVMSRRCTTAQLVIDLLRLGGWTGRPRRCGGECPVY